jgi:hypothetical protein
MNAKKCRCPRINPEDWEGKILDWENKTFYFIPINNFLYKPIDLEEKIKLLRREVAHKGYEFIDINLTLCEWVSFKGRILSQIKNPEKYDESIMLFDFGKIYTTVFKGKAKLLKQAVSDFSSQMELEHNVPVQKVYVWYAHCKICAKERENLAVIFAKT